MCAWACACAFVCCCECGWTPTCLEVVGDEPEYEDDEEEEGLRSGDVIVGIVPAPDIDGEELETCPGPDIGAVVVAEPDPAPDPGIIPDTDTGTGMGTDTEEDMEGIEDIDA